MRIQYADAYIIFIELQTRENNSDQMKYPHNHVTGIIDQAA